MALQASQIVDYTRSLIDEVNESPVLLDSEILNFINRRYHEVEDVIKSVHEDYFGTTGTISLSNGTELYDLPQDANSRNNVDRVIRVEVSYDGSNYDIARATSIQRKITTESNSNGSYSEAFPLFYLFGDQIGLLPIPTGTGTAKIWYIKRLADLENDTDIPEIPDKYHRLLAVGAAVEALRKDYYYPESDRLERDYYRSLDDMKMYITPRQMTEIKTVRPKRKYGVYSPENYIRRGTLS